MKVAWISYAPVKGMRLQSLERTELKRAGVPGDRAFMVADEQGRMVNGKGAAPIMRVIPKHDIVAGTLTLEFPDGTSESSRIDLGDPEDVAFYGLNLEVRPLLGPLSDALSEQCGMELRLLAAPPDRPGADRGYDGAATILSYASLERLAEVAGVDGEVDHRRFRMNFGVEGAGAHEEDQWIDRPVRIGDAIVEVKAHVGRCAVTTRNADTGEVDFKTLHYIGEYRKDIESFEPLPFGVYGRVVKEGRVAIGDDVEPIDF